MQKVPKVSVSGQNPGYEAQGIQYRKKKESGREHEDQEPNANGASAETQHWSGLYECSM